MSEKLLPYEEKFIVEINETEIVNGYGVHKKIYPVKKGISGNAYAMCYDTDPNNAIKFDTYQEAQEKLIDDVTKFYSQSKIYSGSVNKIIVARKNDLEKEYKIGETVMAESYGLPELREMEILHFSSYGYNEICVKGKRSDYDWFWTKNFKKIK